MFVWMQIPFCKENLLKFVRASVSQAQHTFSNLDLGLFLSTYETHIYILFILFSDKVAIKVVDRGRLDARALRMLSREVTTLECVHHPNILR